MAPWSLNIFPFDENSRINQLYAQQLSGNIDQIWIQNQKTKKEHIAHLYVNQI